MAKNDNLILWASMLLVISSSGCLMESGYPEDTESESGGGLSFNWSPPTDVNDFVVRLQIDVGPETKCIMNRDMMSYNESPYGISSYTFHHDPKITLSGVGLGLHEPVTLHADSFNTGQVTYPSKIGGWSTGTGSWTVNETYYFLDRIHAEFELDGWLNDRKDDTPWLEVDCDSKDALIRFYEADDWEAIYSHYGTGGIGISTFFPTVGALAIDRNVTYAIDTQGNHVHLSAAPMPESVTGTMIQDGEVRLSTPEGNEVVPIDDLSQQPSVNRNYGTPGQYMFQIDRVSVGVGPYMGIMAGFVETQRIGDLEEPHSREPRSN